MPKKKILNLQYSDFDEPVRQIEQKLEYYLQTQDQHKLRTDEKYILNDAQFQGAITEAREKLKIENDYLEYEDDLDDWIVALLSGKDSSSIEKYGSEYDEYIEKYNRIAWTATEKANLPYGWHDWVRLYIATNQPPKDIIIEPSIQDIIEIIGMDDDSLVIRLNKGIKAEEYRSAWKAFAEFLKGSSAYRPYAHILKNKIYLDHTKGMSVGEIVDKYFSEETDRIASHDKVRKIIKRFSA